MAGTKTSGNPYSIPINLDKELGEAIIHLILETGYGKSTFMVKEFMEKHKDELIDFWNKQEKDGLATFERWYAKWNMKESEQKKIDVQKQKDTHDALIKQYLVLGRTPEEAEEFSTAFPNGDPIEVVRIRTYSSQNKPEPKPILSEQEKKWLQEQIPIWETRIANTQKGIDEGKNDPVGAGKLIEDLKSKIVDAKRKLGETA